MSNEIQMILETLLYFFVLICNSNFGFGLMPDPKAHDATFVKIKS